MWKTLIGLFVLTAIAPAFAQKLAVKIINREDKHGGTASASKWTPARPPERWFSRSGVRSRNWSVR